MMLLESDIHTLPIPRRLFLLSIALVALRLALQAQVNTGELRIRVTDQSGSGLAATIKLSSEVNQIHATFATNQGHALRSQMGSPLKA